MQKVCLIGSSLITSIYAKMLSSFAEVEVYEHGTLGGAWQSKDIHGYRFSAFNNIICPMRPEEEIYIPKIKNLFEKSDVKLTKYIDLIDLQCDYTPTSYLLGNFYQYIEKVFKSEGIRLVKNKVKSLCVSKSELLVNQQKYDLIILPENYIIDHLKIGNKLVPLAYNKHISKHARILFDRQLKGPKYCESFDAVFDRGGITEIDGKSLFIGRVRRNHKHFNLADLISKSTFLSTNANHVINQQLEKYDHSYPSESTQTMMKLKDESEHIIQIKSRQFVASFAEINSTMAIIKDLLNKRTE